MPIINDRNVSVTANTKFLASDIAPTTADGWVRIYIIPTLAGKLTVVHDDGTNEDEGVLGFDVEIPAGAAVAYPVPVPAGENVNFKFSVTTTLKKLIIVEA